MQARYPVSVWRHLVYNLERRKEVCGSSHLLSDLVCNFIFRCSILEAGLGADDEEHLGPTALLTLILTNHWDKPLGSKDFSKTQQYFIAVLAVLYK